MIVSVAMMMAAAMAFAWSLSNRRARVLPQWTLIPTVLLALVGLGGAATAWIGFILLPAWSAILGICLLALREPEPAAA